MKRTRSKPRVLVIGPLKGTGGMVTSMRLQLSSPLKTQYKLIALDNSKRTPSKRRLWQGIAAQLHLIIQLWRTISRHQPDIVHIHTCSGLTFFRSIIDLWIAKLHGAPVILHIRGGQFGKFLHSVGPLKRWSVRHALTYADRVIALSPGWARRLGRFDSRISVCVVNNGVQVPQRSKPRRRTKRFRVVFVGALKASKGVDDLIAAIGQLPADLRSRLSVRIIGPDPGGRTEALREKVREQGLEGSVCFTGALVPEGVRAELERGSVFVLPSYAEGMPNALLEAMACGLPSITTDVGAVPEMITDGVDGFVIAPGDVRGLRRCLKKLAGDFELCRRMGRDARRRVRETFTAEQSSEDLAEIYHGILEKETVPILFGTQIARE